MRNDPAMLGTPKHVRIPNDNYNTIDGRPLVSVMKSGFVRSKGIIHEPGCGTGCLSRPLQMDYGRDVYSSDIQHYGYNRQQEVVDYLTMTEAPAGATITLGNPPFDKNIVDKFIEHAINLMKPVRGQVVMLLRKEWDSAKKRVKLLKEHPAFAGKVELTYRPYWFEPGPGSSSPRHNYTWFIWDWEWPGEPVVRYG